MRTGTGQRRPECLVARDRTRNRGRDSAAEDLLGTHRVLHVPDDSRLLYQSLCSKRGTLLTLSSLALSLSLSFSSLSHPSLSLSFSLSLSSTDSSDTIHHTALVFDEV